MKTQITSRRMFAPKISALAGFAYLAALMSGLPAVAHSGDTLSPITASQSFMQAYFLPNDDNLKSALRVTIGEAKAAVKKKLAATKEASGGLVTASMVPLQYISNKRVNDKEYLVVWSYQPGKGKPYKVTTTSVKRGNAWLISKFTSNKK
jgi:hypothetical protein